MWVALRGTGGGGFSNSRAVPKGAGLQSMSKDLDVLDVDVEAELLDADGGVLERLNLRLGRLSSSSIAAKR